MSSSGSFRNWAQLVRLPNTFTVIADVTAGFLLVALGPTPPMRLVVVVLAAIALYWAGMILNDVFDLEKDRRERPQRPLPAGRIPLSHAKFAGWWLLVGGALVAGLAGFLPHASTASTWRPAIVAVVLAVMIVLYDGPLKRTAAAPLAMGACRFLSFLLGASVVLTEPLESLDQFAPRYVLAFAAGMGVYIMGVTNMARHEAAAAVIRSPTLPIGLIVAMLGAVILALAPSMAPDDVGWQVSPQRGFPMLIGLIAFAVCFRGVRVLLHPDPRSLGMLIRVAILNVIPFSAAIAFLAAGPIWGLGIFALVVPAIVLSARFRVT